LTVYGLTRAGDRATLADVGLLATAGTGLLGLLAYAVHARRTAHPLLDLSLYRMPAYAAASAAAMFTGAALFGAALLFPLYLQLARGEDVLGAGLALISLGVGTAIMSPLSGRLTDRFGGGPVATIGALLTAASTAPFALLDAAVDGVILQALLLARGLTIALAVTPVITAGYAAVDAQRLPDATTQVNILMRLGGALGGALFAVIVARQLPHGAEHAFHAAFAWLTAASLLGLAPALALWRATSRIHKTANKEEIR
jgi:predicted MFS family arabinose efflux permease